MIGNIYITRQIGSFDGFKGVELLDVMKQVKEYPDATAYNVYIDSEGGLVDTGFDIYNYLISLGKPITTIGTGMVASIATVIFMAGQTRYIQEGTRFMIHLPWDMPVGNSYELQMVVDSLEQYNKRMVDFYKKALDIQEEGILPLLKNETWLTPEQLNTLGFTNSQVPQLTAVAKLKPKNNTNNNNMELTEKDKGWLKEQLDAVAKLFKGKPKAKVLTDANGVSVDFTDVADDAAITVGMMATIDGAPAEGSYVMSDGNTYVFVAGELTEIIEAEPTDDAAAKLAALEAENEALKAERDAALASVTEKENENKEIEKAFNKLKTEVKSKFDFDGKDNVPKGKGGDEKTPENRFKGISEKVKQLKK